MCSYCTNVYDLFLCVIYNHFLIHRCLFPKFWNQGKPVFSMMRTCFRTDFSPAPVANMGLIKYCYIFFIECFFDQSLAFLSVINEFYNICMKSTVCLYIYITVCLLFYLPLYKCVH